MTPVNVETLLLVDFPEIVDIRRVLELGCGYVYRIAVERRGERVVGVLGPMEIEARYGRFVDAFECVYYAACAQADRQWRVRARRTMEFVR